MYCIVALNARCTVEYMKNSIIQNVPIILMPKQSCSVLRLLHHNFCVVNVHFTFVKQLKVKSLNKELYKFKKQAFDIEAKKDGKS